MRMSLEELQDSLNPIEGKLNIDVVFINTHEANKIAKVFQNLSVPQIFTFS